MEKSARRTKKSVSTPPLDGIVCMMSMHDNIFKDKSDQFVVVDISKSDWIPFMCNLVGVEPIYHKDIKPNNSENFDIDLTALESVYDQARPHRG